MLWVQRVSKLTTPAIFNHKALMAPQGPGVPSLFATIQVHTFSLCLIISNWKKNCLANQLASPQLWCPSNPALGVTPERRRFATSTLQGALSKGRRHRYAPRLAYPLPAAPHPHMRARARACPRTLHGGHWRSACLKRNLSLSGKHKVSQK